MVKIYSLGAGTAIEKNGIVQVVPRGTIEASTAGDKIQLNRIGLGSITGLQDFGEYTDADGNPLGGDVDETLEALSNFFFDDLEGYQYRAVFDVPAGGNIVIDLETSLQVEINSNYLLESKLYAKGPEDNPYSCVVESRSFLRYYDNGTGTPALVGTQNSLPVPSLASGGVAFSAFLLGSAGQLFYRIQASAAPDISCKLLFSKIKF